MCCSVLQCVAVCCSVLQCVAVCCSVLQCEAACCSVLQYVAVCCSVLQWGKLQTNWTHILMCPRGRIRTCTYTHMYIYINIYARTVHLSFGPHLHTHTYIHIYLYTHMHMHIRMHIHSCHSDRLIRRDTGWRRHIGYLSFICHFPQEIPISIGSFAKNDLQPAHLFLQKKKICNLLWGGYD